MSFVYGIEPEQTFRSLMDYFSGRHVKILSCHEPSVIRVEFGSFASWAAGKKGGKANFTIIKRNGSSFVNVNFDFATTYGLGLIIASIAAIFVFATGLIVYGQLAYTLVVLVLVALLAFVFVMAIIDYSVSGTKEGFLYELNAFLDSLSVVEGRLIRRLKNSNGTGA